MKYFILLAVVGTALGGGPDGPAPTPSAAITCERDGKTYSLGESVPSRNPCEVGCTCGPEGEIICSPVPCGHHTSCGGLPRVIPEGECCPKCPECVINGTSYEPGDKLPLGDPCSLMCVCTNERRVSCVPGRVGCRGPEPCPSGTKLVTETVPGECCKKYTCANVTCEVDGLSYLVGDNIPKENPCRLCHCGADGEEVCGVIDCPLIRCPRGKYLVKTEVPGRCCPDVECVNITCESDGVTYQLGDKVPHEDPCSFCECGSGDGAKGRVICARVPCGQHTSCGGLPRVIPEGECCPECPECIINGTSYEPGDKLPLGDPCSLMCVCTNERRVACVPGRVGCRGPEPCPSGTKLVTETVPGECCKKYTCANVTCEVDGVSYSVGDNIPKENPCRLCHCGADGEEVCGVIDCPLIRCPRGKYLVKTEVPGQCCLDQECVNITCESDGVTYQLGDKVPQEDPCSFCECASGDGAKGRVICASISCPPPLVCPPFHELVVRRAEGECCPEQFCSHRCPPPCTRKLCKSDANALCSIPSGGSCVSDCNVTTCKACYYSEEPPRSLPTGCEKYNCEAVKNDATRVSKCLKRFGRCIGKQDKKQYGKPESSIVRPRNFKCYAYPCEE